MKKIFITATALVTTFLLRVDAQEGLPLGWHATDIGSQSVPGSTTYDPEAEIFTLESTGDQIFRPDNLHFAYTVQTGNFEIITLVSYVYGMGAMGFDTDPFEEAGVMIREDLSPFSNTYYLSVLGGDRGGIRYYIRNNDDLEKRNHPGEGARNMLVPCWLKLKRIGNRFDSYFSQDGTNWVYSPEASEQIEMNATCYAGLWCRGNANFVEINGWDNPNPQPIVPMVAEFESTRIEEIANIYAVQNPISAYFVNVSRDISYISVANVFGRLESDEIDYSVSSSSNSICRVSVLSGTDSLLFRPGKTGSCTMTLTGDVNSFSLINKFPVFVWDAPRGWSSQDLGIPAKEGFVMKEGELLIIGGAASGSSTQLTEGSHFMHRTLEGDAVLSARVTSATFATPGGVCGISVRADSISPGAVMVRLVYSGTGEARFETRGSQGEPVTLLASQPAELPLWIGLEKEGNQVSAYISGDGESWSQLGSNLVIDLAGGYSLGYLSGSSDNDNLSICTFDHLLLDHSALDLNNPVAEQRMVTGTTKEIDISQVFGHPENQLLSLSIENSDPGVLSATLDGDSVLMLEALGAGESLITLTAGTEPNGAVNEIPVVVTDPVGQEWQFADVGEVLYEGYAAGEGDGAFSIATYGTGIRGTSDSYSFLYQEREGTQQITAKIEEIEERGGGSQAGIMFRESADPGSLYIMYTATAYEGIKFQYRWDDDSQPVVEVSDPDLQPPCWLRLKRDEYNYFTASYSLDGTNWIPHGEFSVPLDLPPTVLVGLAATSGFFEGTGLYGEVDISMPTGLSEQETIRPLQVTHHPNPVTGMTIFTIDALEETEMQITLYDMAGRRIMELMNGRIMPGRHHIHFDAGLLAGGTYFYRVVTPGYLFTNKMLKVK
ncbi:MAG: T9SS type A sorting domain-containing protein [Bacteroidales bacterium]